MQVNEIRSVLSDFREYVIREGRFAGGAHHNPIWVKVADALSATPAPAGGVKCNGILCLRRDGILCAEGECDIENGVYGSPAPAGDVGELIERLEFAQEWLRKPDHADHFSMADMARWVNDRPFNTIKAAANALRALTSQVERLEAEIVGESATAHFQEARAEAAEARAKELEAALETLRSLLPSKLFQLTDYAPVHGGIVRIIDGTLGLASKGGSGE